jgi:hypothetical protein
MLSCSRSLSGRPQPPAPIDIETIVEDKEPHDTNLVDWKPDDLENPRNWSLGYKCWVTFQLGMLAFSASLGSSITSPAENAIAQYIGVSSEVAVLSISLYM